MNHGLRVNDRLRTPESSEPHWEVVDPIPRRGYVKVFDLEKHREEFRKFSEINDAIIDGALILERVRAPRVTPAAQDDPELERCTKQAMDHLARVEEIRKRDQVSFNVAYFRTLDEFNQAADASNFESRATLYRYALNARLGLPLIRGNKNKGNRAPRYSADVIQLICVEAESKFLVPGSLWRFGRLVKHINETGQERKLLGETQHISPEYVAKVIFENLSADTEIDRMDPKLVAAAKSFAANRIVAALRLERVEQDAVHLPFVVATPDGNSTDVWLVHAIDCCTGVPVGWRIVVGHPQESDSLKCVEMILFPKAHVFERLGIASAIDAYGTPNVLVFDNGPEGKGERVEGLTRIGINPHWLKSRQPHKKPFIERLNRALKEALEVLGGCTRFNGKDGARDPIAHGDKLPTLEELERWIVKWYFEEWVHRPLKRHVISDFHDMVKLGSTPGSRWKRMDELRYSKPLSPRRRDFEMCLYEHDVGTLNRKTGITTKTFNYRIGDLGYLLANHAERQINFYRNPDDYRRIFVDDGADRPWVPLQEEGVTETTPALTFVQAREQLDREKAAHASNGRLSEFEKEINAASTSSMGKGKKSRADTNKDVADAHRHKEAVQRAAAAPVDPPRASTPPNGETDANVSFDNVSVFEAVDRVTGKVL
jgi:putative transposase